MFSKPFIGVPPPWSGWTQEAREQVIAESRVRCTHCHDPNGTVIPLVVDSENKTLSHFPLFKGIDWISKEYLKANPKKLNLDDYVPMDLEGWTVHMVTIEELQPGLLASADSMLQTSKAKILVPKPTHHRQHLLGLLRDPRDMNPRNAKIVLPFLKKLFDYAHGFEPVNQDQYLGAPHDALFTLCSGEGQKVALYPVARRKAEDLHATLEKEVAFARFFPLAADPYIFFNPDAGPGPTDLAPVLGTGPQNTIIFQKLQDQPTGNGIDNRPHMVTDDTMFIDYEHMTPKDVDEILKHFNRDNIPQMMEMNGVRMSLQPPRKRSADAMNGVEKCRGPLCSPEARMDLAGSFCAKCAVYIGMHAKKFDDNTRTWAWLEKNNAGHHDVKPCPRCVEFCTTQCPCSCHRT